MTGGQDGLYHYLDSTELLVPRSALRVATAANTLYGSYHVNLYLTGEWIAFI